MLSRAISALFLSILIQNGILKNRSNFREAPVSAPSGSDTGNPLWNGALVLVGASGADSGFSFGGGGGGKRLCSCTPSRAWSPKSLTAGLQGPLKGSAWKLLKGFRRALVLCEHFDTKWDIKIIVDPRELISIKKAGAYIPGPPLP